MTTAQLWPHAKSGLMSQSCRIAASQMPAVCPISCCRSGSKRNHRRARSGKMLLEHVALLAGLCARGDLIQSPVKSEQWLVLLVIVGSFRAIHPMEGEMIGSEVL